MRAIDHTDNPLDTRPMRLSNLDLNLLVALQALLQERSVSRAAARVGLSQPAMSAALARLRRHFGDELLSRSGNSYLLTPLATQLQERTEVAVTSVRRVFSAQPDFDPAATEREFRVIMSDYSLAVLGHTLSAITDREAPHARLHIEPLSTDAVDNAIETLRTDDALVLPHGFVSDLPYLDLYSDEWVCLVAGDNDTVGDRLTLDQLADLPWVLTYHRPTAYTPAAKQMQVLGIEPRVRMVAETFVALPFLIAGTNRVALIQRKLAAQLHNTGNVRIVACPFDAPPIVEALWWHPMYEHDLGHQWLRRLFATAGAQIDSAYPRHG